MYTTVYYAILSPVRTLSKHRVHPFCSPQPRSRLSSVPSSSCPSGHDTTTIAPTVLLHYHYTTITTSPSLFSIVLAAFIVPFARFSRPVHIWSTPCLHHGHTLFTSSSHPRHRLFIDALAAFIGLLFIVPFALLCALMLTGDCCSKRHGCAIQV